MGRTKLTRRAFLGVAGSAALTLAACGGNGGGAPAPEGGSEGGEPDHTHIVCPIVSAVAVDTLKKALPSKTTLWTGAVDEELTSHSFVVPGLGDAGDLAYGEKVQVD